jgi:GTP-binding protein Era
MSSMPVSSDSDWPRGRVGYVALLGRPNVGKSTFLNTVIGQHLAAVSALPQTTRRRFLGIYSDVGVQMLFLDAPGVHRPADELGQCMDRAVLRVLGEADVVLCIADPTRAPGEEDGLVAARAAAATTEAVILALNKCDAATVEQMARTEAFYRGHLPAAVVQRVSALDRASLLPLLASITQALPEGPFLYDPEQLTDSFERDIGAELIREACLLHLRQEVPHALAVAIDEWADAARPVRIQATLHVERESQKGIVVGHGGAVIAAIRKDAQARLKVLCDGPVTLRLWVKVSPDWRERRGLLRDFRLNE